MSLGSGQMLAHYCIVEPIGKGGMGEVFRATDTKLRRDVAVKVLPSDIAHSEGLLVRLEREARLLASLNHPNIASIHGLEEFDGGCCLVLELVEGVTLADRIASGALSVDEMREMGRQIAAALEAAHDKGIIHRDLKPSNVMVAPDGTVKVLDFGLGKVLDVGALSSQAPTATVKRTHEGIIVGTLPYMSPEQANGKPVDKRTDVWAFGCLLYECLTGEVAFRGETASETAARILQTEPDWSKLPPQTPPSIRRLMRRCLEKDPRRRIHDIADARIELEDEPESEIATTPTEPGKRWRGVTLGVGLAGLSLGALGVALIGFPQRDAAPKLPRLVGRFSVPTLGDAALFPIPGAPALAVSPDGEWFAYVSTAGADAELSLGGDVPGRRTQIFLRRSDAFEAHPLDRAPGASAPFFSPDGKWLGYFDRLDGKLKKQSLNGGAPVSLCDAGLTFRGASWGDDDRIYFAGFAGGIMVVPAAGGEPEQLTFPDREAGVKTHRYPHVLPGARGLLFTIGSSEIATYSDASVALLSFATGETRILQEGGTNPRYTPTGHIVYARGDLLLAIPFDLETLQVHGSPFPVLDGVVTSDGWGSAQFGFSDNGLLAYVPGGPDLYHVKLYWIDREGKTEPLPVPADGYGNVSLSPDGKRLALNIAGANASIWTYDSERQTMTRLTRQWDCYAPIWSRDGKRLTFGSNWGGVPGIWQIRSDGSGDPERLFDTTQMSVPAAWLPGDKTLFYIRNSFMGSGIWAWSGDESRALLDTPYQETQMELSPDGRWVAYVSDESGRPEVYVTPVSFSGQKWRLSVDGGGNPRWSPDGTELFYWERARLMAVSLAADDEGFVPGKPRALFETGFNEIRNFAVGPDGQRFVVNGRMHPPGHDSSPNLVVEEFRVVVDWFDEIRQQAARSGF